MANRHVESSYQQYWNLVKETRHHKGQIVIMQIPPELQDKVIKAIRKRKYLEQAKYGLNYGQLFAKKRGNEVHMQLLPPMEKRI